ncbi:hypothetical protein GCM10028805_64490 [Spirosoma harenae]
MSAEVNWTTIPDGGVITVQLGAQTKTITTRAVSTVTDADVHSPQMVAFEVNATGAPVTVSATYETCTESSTLVTPNPCPPLGCAGLGGTVFKDFNADGIHQPGETTGLPDIVVRAISHTGSILTTTTDSIGKYTLAVSPSAYPVRVEFSNIPSYAGNGTVNGPNGRTSVQFVNSPDCAVDLGLLNAQEHCQTDPLLIIPCFVNGDPLPVGSDSGPIDALVAFPYSLRGNKDMGNVTSVLATASQIGSVWGSAYSKFTKRLYTSAFVRRHVGLGPGGIGGIYLTDMSGPGLSTANTSLFVDLTTLGINLGSIPSNSARGLQPGIFTASHDENAFSAIGKVGIGDMDLAEDGSMLWFTNLSDGQLYSLRLSGNSVPTSSDWAVHPLPVDNICTNGIRRIWGVKAYQGKIYVGAVCDASVSKDKRDLRAMVFAYTPGTGNSLGSGGTYKIVFDFPLTYPKGAPDRTDFSLRGWFPWEDTFANFQEVGTDHFIIHPQPILADIQFDIDGSMVLGFNDRSGLQFGNQNFSPIETDATLYYNISGGDVLRAFFSNGAYVLENSGQAGPNKGSSTNNNQGPGGGEFYNDDFYYGGQLIHSENANGSLAIRPGSGEVVVSTMDPLDDQAWSGGLRFLSNTTGYYTTGNNATSAYVVYRTQDGDGATFGKATGLGGVGIACDLPTYLQIGNRVWIDEDHDGEQDPDEKGLANVNVSLYQSGTLVTTTTTNADGEYYFTYSPTSSTVSGTTSALLPNSTYQIVFGTGGQFDGHVLTADEGRYLLTMANETGGNLNDMNDSDAEVTTFSSFTAPAISVTTGNNGSVDHSFDVGFYCLTIGVASVSVTAPTCPPSSIVANNDGRIDLSGIQNANKTFLYTTSTPPAYTAVSESRTVVNGSVSYTDLPNPASSSGTSYSVIVYNGPNCFTIVSAVLPQNTCVPSIGLTVTPGVCNTLTNEYTLTGVISLTNSITDLLTLTDGNITETISVTVGQTSVPYSLSGLESGSGVHSLSVSYADQTVSQTYTAPASCTTAASITVTDFVVCAGESVVLTASGCETGTIQWSDGATTTTGNSLTISTSGLTTITTPTVLTYTATCTIGNSIATDVASVSVNPKPTIGGVSSICSWPQSYTILLNGFTNPLTYELVRGSSFDTGTHITTGQTPLAATGALAPVQAAGTYWIRVYNAAGCYSDHSIQVQACTPPPSITVTDAVVCAGESVILTASGCETGTIEWSDGSTTTTGTSITVSTSNLVNIASPVVLNYMATCTIGNNTATDVASINVNPKPTVGGISALCSGPQAYTILLTGFASQLSYELVQGSSFETGTHITTGKTPLTVNGALTPVQVAGTYWVRVYNAAGCFTDLSIEVQACVCPTGKCVPIVIKRVPR